MILLTAFGPFGDVVDNPSARLVRAVHGLVAGGHRLEALVLPVQWGEATRRTLLAAASMRPTLVLGFGVATARDDVDVETVGRPVRLGLDVLGHEAPPLPPGATDQPATIDAARLAATLGARLSTDAGSFLCNAWLHEVAAAFPGPTGFVHVPPAGMAPQRLLEALDGYCG